MSADLWPLQENSEIGDRDRVCLYGRGRPQASSLKPRHEISPAPVVVEGRRRLSGSTQQQMIVEATTLIFGIARVRQRQSQRERRQRTSHGFMSSAWDHTNALALITGDEGTTHERRVAMDGTGRASRIASTRGIRRGGVRLYRGRARRRTVTGSVAQMVGSTLMPGWWRASPRDRCRIRREAVC